MTNPRRPFRLNVGFIVHQEVGYKHEFPFEFDQIQISDDLDLRHFEGIATIGRTQQGLILQGKFNARTTVECVRCLNEFEQHVKFKITELYAFKNKAVSDTDLILPDDAQIDLQSLVREYALLDLPIKPLCKPNCKGLCSVCGEDLNQTDCGHGDLKEDSPFAALKDLLKED